MIVAAVADSALAMHNPILAIKLAWRLPGGYLALVGCWFGLEALAGFIGWRVDAIVAAAPVPVLTPLVGLIVKLPVHLIAAFALGRFVYQHCADLRLLDLQT